MIPSTYIPPIQTTTKKKEKPLIKTPIPGTEWLRVVTSEGNTFYSHKLKKESVWAIPEEVRSAIERLQTEERRQQPTQDSISVNSKRKAEISLVGDETLVNKRAKINDEDDDDNDGDNDEETSGDEDWQRQAEEQLATEAEEERKRVEAEMEKEKEEEARVRAAAEIIMPQKVDLSIEEGKALFKVSLTSSAH
jgi:transcription elongation regulator 1